MAKIQANESIQDWIVRAPEGPCAALNRLRELIQNLPAQLDERVKWSQPCYGRDKANAFSLDWHPGYATLQLWAGAHLPDPEGIVEGTGKDLRHVKIKSADAANWDAVQDLMLANLHHLGWLS